METVRRHSTPPVSDAASQCVFARRADAMSFKTVPVTA